MAFWPSRREVENLDLVPPTLAVDTVRLRHILVEVAAQHAAQGYLWRPAICPALFEPLVRAVNAIDGNIQPVGLSCGRVEETVQAAEHGLPSVMILYSPVAGCGPNRLAELARSTEVVVACDHFAQAERLAAACRAAGTTLHVRLRIDVGRGRIGVRPGPDLDDLARGISTLEPLQLSGLMFPALEALPFGTASLGPSGLLSIVDRSCSIMERCGLAVKTLSLGHIDDLPKLSRFSAINLEARTPVPDGEYGPFAILAGVVGRPTRDQAVIDAGRRVLGADAVVADHRRNDIAIRAIEDDFAVLQLKSDREELTIGDMLPLVPQQGFAQMPRLSIIYREKHGWKADGSF